LRYIALNNLFLQPQKNAQFGEPEVGTDTATVISGFEPQEASAEEKQGADGNQELQDRQQEDPQQELQDSGEWFFNWTAAEIGEGIPSNWADCIRKRKGTADIEYGF